MDTVSRSATTIYSRQTLRKQQREVYHKIPGMFELLHATPDTVPVLLPSIHLMLGMEQTALPEQVEALAL